MDGILGSLLVMVCSYTECTLYSVFDIEEGGGVELTNFLWYFETMTVESGVIVNDTIKASFCIVLKYN